MGAWGTGIYENDDALDFIYELAERGGVVLSEALTQSRNALAAGYIEVDLGSRGLAACDVVAAALGPAKNALPEFEGVDSKGFAEFIDALAVPLRQDPSVFDICLELVGSISEPGKSELAELWDEAGTTDVTKFDETVGQLKSRLEKAAP